MCLMRWIMSIWH